MLFDLFKTMLFAPSETETNKALIKSYLHHLSTREYDKMQSCLAAGAPYWVQGDKNHNPWAGDGLAADRVASLPVVIGHFETYCFKIIELVAERDHVIAYGRATGDGPDRTNLYDILVIMIFSLKDGKITQIREFLDTAKVERMVAQHT